MMFNNLTQNSTMHKNRGGCKRMHRNVIWFRIEGLHWSHWLIFTAKHLHNIFWFWLITLHISYIFCIKHPTFQSKVDTLLMQELIHLFELLENLG